jgi:hypothetical protein
VPLTHNFRRRSSRISKAGHHPYATLPSGDIIAAAALHRAMPMAASWQRDHVAYFVIRVSARRLARMYAEMQASLPRPKVVVGCNTLLG